MKTFSSYFGTISIILGLLPLLLLRDISIVYTNLTGIVSALSGLMFITILLTLLDIIDNRCLTIQKKCPGSVIQKDFFTVPVLCIVYLLEIVIFYFVNPTFVKEHLDTFAGAIVGIVFVFAIYAIVDETYMLMETSEIEEKKTEKE